MVCKGNNRRWKNKDKDRQIFVNLQNLAEYDKVHKKI